MNNETQFIRLRGQCLDQGKSKSNRMLHFFAKLNLMRELRLCFTRSWTLNSFGIAQKLLYSKPFLKIDQTIESSFLVTGPGHQPGVSVLEHSYVNTGRIQPAGDSFSPGNARHRLVQLPVLWAGSAWCTPRARWAQPRCPRARAQWPEGSSWSASPASQSSAGSQAAEVCQMCACLI